MWKCDPKIRDQWWKWVAPASGGEQLENRETRRVVGPDDILPGEEIVQFDPKDAKADLTTTRAHNN